MISLMIDRRVRVLNGEVGEADTTVSGLRDRSFLVLLGEPGIGKTTVLETEAEFENTHVIKVRELINQTVDFKATALFIDALDEYRVGAIDLDKAHLLANAIKRLGVARWRLTCRSEDWQKSADIEAIKHTTNGTPITVAQILPLDSTESIAVLRALGESSPDTFVDRAHAMGAAGLLESPLSIRLLRDAIALGGNWPATRFSLFAQATFSLAHEDNKVHRLDRTRANANDILSAAARASLFLLVTGSRYLWRSGALPPSDDTRAYLSADDLQLERPLIDDMLGSALFRGEGEEFEPVHRTIAEFLGARALARTVVGDGNRAALPLGRAKALITGSDGRAPTDLRGLYGWFAAHLAVMGRHDLAHELVQADAVSVLVYSDAAAFDTDTKRAIIANLDRDDPYFRASEVGATAVGGLACEELAEDFAKALKHGDGSHRMMTVYEVLTVGQPVVSLRPELWSIAVDPARPEWQRMRAVAAWLNGQEDVATARRTLFDALAGEPASGPREFLRADLLGNLPPDLVTIDDITSVLRDHAAVADDETVMHLFGLERSLIANPRPDLFDRPFNWLSDTSHRHGNFNFENLIDHALAAAIGATPDLDGARLWRWLEHARENRWNNLKEHSRRAVREWLAARSGRDVELFEVVLATDVGTDKPWMVTFYFSMVAGSPGVPILDRLIERATIARGTARRRVLEIAVNIGRNEDIGIDAYWRLHAFLDGLPRGSKSLIRTLTVTDIPDWRRREQKRTERYQKKKSKERKDNDRIWRRLIPELRQGKRTQTLDWAAQVYFRQLGEDNENRTGIERLNARVASDVLDAVLHGWHQLATHENPDHEPAKLAEVEVSSRRYYSEQAAIAGLDRLRCEAAPVDLMTLPMSLALVMLRSRWVVRRNDVRNDLETWAWGRLNIYPQEGAAMLVAFWDAILAGGVSSTRIWSAAGDERGGEAVRLAVNSMLERHPAMAAPVLNTLVLQGAKHIDRAGMARLAANALALPEVTGKQRSIWAVVAFLTNPVHQQGQLEGLAGEDLQELFGDHFHGGLIHAFMPETAAEQTAIDATIFQVLASQADPYVERRSGQGSNAHRLSDAANSALKRLGASSDVAATGVIAQLQSKLAAFPKWDASLRHTAAQQARARRDREFEPPSAVAVAEVLAGNAPVNAADLRAILVDELRRFSRELRTGTSSNWRDYWNTNSDGKATDPKIENVSRDITLGRLRERIAKYQIAVATPEAQQRDDTRVDILFVTGAGRTLPVEAKRHYHPDLWNTATGQLQGYTNTENAEGLGILLVFWFGDVRPPPARGDGRVPRNAAELEALLVGDLRADLKERTDIVVLDVSSLNRSEFAGGSNT